MILHTLSQILLSVSLLIYMVIPVVVIRFLLIRNRKTFSPEIWIIFCSITILVFILSYIIDFDIYIQSNFTIPLTLPLFGDFITFLVFFLCYNLLAYYNTKKIQKSYLKHLGISIILLVLTFVGSMITDVISNGPMFGVILEFRSPFVLRFIGYATYFLGYAGFGIVLIHAYTESSRIVSIRDSQQIIHLFQYLIFTFGFWVVTLNMPNAFINLTGEEFLKFLIPSTITILGFLFLVIQMDLIKKARWQKE